MVEVRMNLEYALDLPTKSKHEKSRKTLLMLLIISLSLSDPGSRIKALHKVSVFGQQSGRRHSPAPLTRIPGQLSVSWPGIASTWTGIDMLSCLTVDQSQTPTKVIATNPVADSAHVLCQERRGLRNSPRAKRKRRTLSTTGYPIEASKSRCH